MSQTDYHLAGKLLIPLIGAACWLFAPAQASADSLKQALAAAYKHNPTLEAQRTRVRATDESVLIANSGFLPRVSANGALGWTDTTTTGGPGQVIVVNPTTAVSTVGTNRTATYGVALTQPIFNGFQISNRVRIAEAGARGSQQQLRDIERTILFDAVNAYVGVLGAQRTITLQEQGIAAIDKLLRSTRERRTFNEATNTDVAQAQLRLSDVRSRVEIGRAELRTARSAYLNIIGNEPSGLADPVLPRNMPNSLSEALGIAAKESPNILLALYVEEAGRYNVDLVRGRLLPTAQLEAGYTNTYSDIEDVGSRSKIYAIQGRVNVPLYDGGEIRAQIREAKQIHLSQMQELDAVRSQVIRAVSTAWSQLESAKARIRVGQDLIRAAEAALDGVRKEETLGQRTLLDVLNAEQDLRAARVALVEARRTQIVAAYQVLGQIGRLEAAQLDLGTLVYDPAVHYEEVNGRWRRLTISYPDGRNTVMQ